MCQAYEAERKAIITMENRATISGFAAARLGKPIDSNPYLGWSKNRREAWNQGWRCWHECTLPNALLDKYGSIYEPEDRVKILKACEQFKTTGELPSDLEKLL